MIRGFPHTVWVVCYPNPASEICLCKTILPESSLRPEVEQMEVELWP